MINHSTIIAVRDYFTNLEKERELTTEESNILSQFRLYDDCYPITAVTKTDLECSGFDVSNVSEATMERIANNMADDYCEQLFHSSLDIIAEYMDVPRQGENDEEEDD